VKGERCRGRGEKVHGSPATRGQAQFTATVTIGAGFSTRSGAPEPGKARNEVKGRSYSLQLTRNEI
jgi:hypothetical protein